MHRFINTLCLFSMGAALIPLTCQAEVNPDLLPMQQIAQQRVKQFASELKTTLSQAIQQGGLTEGVKVCKEQAPVIAEKWSNNGWEIARTSLKVRNTNNAAKNWQLTVLNSFAQQIDSGVPAAEVKYAEVVSDNGNRQFRYMQPIIMDTLCLACHGSNIDVSVQQSLQQDYPQDLATGFNLGELRGAFTVVKSL